MRIDTQTKGDLSLQFVQFDDYIDYRLTEKSTLLQDGEELTGIKTLRHQVARIYTSPENAIDALWDDFTAFTAFGSRFKKPLLTESRVSKPRKLIEKAFGIVHRKARRKHG